MTVPDEPVLYYLQGDDAPQRGFVREELPGCHPTYSYHRMGSSGVEDCVTSFSVAFETGQPGVIQEVLSSRSTLNCCVSSGW